MRTQEEISAMYNKYMDRAKQLEIAKQNRMRKLAKLAHIDSGNCMFIHLHNCTVGNKWATVDYFYIHQMKLIDATLFDGYNLVRKWESRVYNEWRNSPEQIARFS